MDREINFSRTIVKHTPDECAVMVMKNKKRSVVANYTELIGGFVFFSLILMCVYTVYNQIVNDGEEYCGFLTKYRNTFFYPLINTESEWYVTLFLGILYSFGISLAICGLTGFCVSLIYKGKKPLVEESTELEELYRATLKNLEGSFFGGWTLLYMILYILLVVVYTVVSAIKDSETEQVGMAEMIIGIVVVSAIFAVLGLIFYFVFLGVLSKIFESKKNEKFKEELEKYIKREEYKRERKAKIERRNEGDKLFLKAMSGDGIDEALIDEAVKMGSIDASMYRVEEYIYKWYNDRRPYYEKTSFLKQATALLNKIDDNTEEIEFFKKFCYTFENDFIPTEELDTLKNYLSNVSKRVSEKYSDYYKKFDEHIDISISIRNSPSFGSSLDEKKKEDFEIIGIVYVDSTDM